MTTSLLESPLLVHAEEIVAAGRIVKAPPPDLTVSAWADEKRKLSADNNAEPGDWHTDRNPLLREIMDACSDPYVREVTFMKPAQIGGTESMVNNVIGYFIDQDPSAILAIFENEKKMEAWSRERLMAMVMATPCLQGRLDTDHGRSTDNKIDYKKFPGGMLAIANAGSEGDLSSRPVRIVLKDELDKWKMLKAGDPDILADERTATYLTRKKIINLSTPRDHDPDPESPVKSRIYTKYLSSDMRKPYMPCPFCGHEQNFRHEQVRFERPGGTGDIVSDVWLECENPHCAMKIKQMMLTGMRAKGRWIAEKPFTGHVGFGHYLQFFSPWVTLKAYAEKFLRSKRQRDTFKVFMNESMGQPWNPNFVIDGDAKVSPYLRRREMYTDVPIGAAPFLFSFADIQKNRIEVITAAFGPGREMWGIDLSIFPGDTALLTTGHLSEPWQRLEEYRHRTWQHESGEVCRIIRMFIDAGYLQSVVLKFCKGKRPQVWPAKGMNDTTARAPFVSRRPKMDKANRMMYFPIGVNEGKDIVFGSFPIDLPDPVPSPQPSPAGGEGETVSGGVVYPSVPGLLHFNQCFDEDFFRQLLTSERPVYRGRIQVYEKVSTSVRNEGLDLTVGVIAAFESYGMDPKPYVEAMKRKVRNAEGGMRSEEQEQEPQRQKMIMPPRKKNWVTGWRQ
jgi:phage terminase large subunit GpA-like protein